VTTLKLETEIREDHQVRLITEIEPELFEKNKHKAARKIASETRIPGFRPGKAPYDMVRRFVGPEKIEHEAIELLVDEVYPEAIKESGVDPFGPGSLEEIISTDPPKFAFLVPLAPKVTLGDYKAIRKDYEPKEVTEEDIEQFLERLRSSYATAEPVERPAQDGDMVFTIVTATDLKPEEGKDPVIMNDRPIQTEIKEPDETSEEWPFPGFAKSLAGMSAGEEKTVTHQFADDSHYEMMRSREIEYKIKIDSVKVLNKPELNDEFAQTVGEFGDLAALRANIQNGLEANAREEYDQSFFNGLIDEIRKGADIKYPPQLLQDDMDSVLENIQRDLAQQNMDIDTYLKVRQIEREKFIEDEIKPTAVRRIEQRLIMDQLAHDENIQLSNEELQAGFNETLMELQQSTGDFEKMRKQVGNQRLANAVALEAASRMMNRRVLRRIKSIVTGQPEEEVPQATVEAAPEAGEPTSELDAEPTGAAESPAEEAPQAEQSEDQAAEEKTSKSE
jgi:trigger factor